ncbi:WD40 repeat-like protein [Backusella circina FSU 941]|nr:WD40 repeat-like protein [Backusella circina FSU 941]
MAPVSAANPNSLFKYIKKQKKKEQPIVISSDEESGDEIPVITRLTQHTQHTQPVSTGQLNDPIDLDSDTEPMEEYGIPNLQHKIASTQGIENTTVPTPESLLSEPAIHFNNDTTNYVANDNQYHQDEVASFGSPMDQDMFQDFGTESEKVGNMEVPPFTNMQAFPVTQMDLDVNMAESSQSPKSTINLPNNYIKPEASLYELNSIDEVESSNISIQSRLGHKRVLQLNESSLSLESNLDTNNELEEEDAIDIDALRLQAPKSVRTRKYDDMSLSEILGSIELYLQSVSEIETVNDKENMVKTRQTRRTPRQAHIGTSPQFSTSGESSQTSQSVQGISCDFSLPRPYMPTDIWYNCTWEDWAQFHPGDILHVPFNDEEKAIVAQQLGKHQTKKLKMSRSSIDFWQVVEGALPGRTAQDCRYYSYDMEENRFLHDKPVMIRKPKKHPISRNEYMMIRGRRNTGSMGRNSMKLCQWMNLSREDTIGGGSGDALSLAIYRNPRTKNMCVATGSLCDVNVQYNLPGNLRLWDSVVDEVTPLAGHKSVPSNSVDSEEVWRTVTDVKMSKDGSFIISASHDGTAKLWRSKTGKLISTLCYHDESINQLAVNTSVKENVIATCSSDGSATIWSLSRNGRGGNGGPCDLDIERYVQPVVECIQFGRDHTRNQLFMGITNNSPDHPGYVSSFDCERAAPLTRYQSINGSVCAIDISPTGQYIASGNYSNFDGATGDRITHIHDYRREETAIRIHTGHDDVNVVSFSPCERYIASGNADKENAEVVIFDIRHPTRALHTLSHSCTNSTFLSPDSSVGIGGIYWMSNSKQFISGGGDSKVKVWNLSGAQELLKSYETTNCVTSLAVDEDCMTLAAGVAGAQGIVHVWQP